MHSPIRGKLGKLVDIFSGFLHPLRRLRTETGLLFPKGFLALMEQQRCLRRSSRIAEASKRSRQCLQKPKEEKQPKLSLDEMIPIFWRLPTSELVRFISNQSKHPLGKYWSAGLKFVVEKRLPLSIKTSVARETTNHVIYDVSGSKVAEIKHPEHLYRSPLCELIEQVELPSRFPASRESSIVPLWRALRSIPNLNTLALSLSSSTFGLSIWDYYCGDILRVSLENFLVPDLLSQLESLSLSGHDGLGDLAQIIARATSLRKLSVDERQFWALMTTRGKASSGPNASPVRTVLAGLESLSISRGQNESWNGMLDFLASRCTRLHELELPLRGPISDYFAAFQSLPNLKKLGLDAELMPSSRLRQRLAVDDGVVAVASVTEFRWRNKAYVRQDEASLLAMLSKLPNARSFEIQGLPADAMLRLASAVCSKGILSDLQTLRGFRVRDTDPLSYAAFRQFISADNVNLPDTVDLSQVRMATLRGSSSHEFLVDVFRAMESNGATSLLIGAIVLPQALDRLRDYLESINPACAKRGRGLGSVLAWKSDEETDEGNEGNVSGSSRRGRRQEFQFTDFKLEGIKSSGPAKGAAFKVRIYFPIFDPSDDEPKPKRGFQRARCCITTGGMFPRKKSRK